MLEIATAVGTLLILIVSTVTLWYEVWRTPRSDVGIMIVEREDLAVLTDSEGKVRLGRIQLFNEGEMDACVEEYDLSSKVHNAKTGEEFEDVELRHPNSGLREFDLVDELPAGCNKFSFMNVKVKSGDDLPKEGVLKITYKLRVRDNQGEYELVKAEEREFVNESTE